MFTINSYDRALTGKILVFWIGGCLWEVVTLGGSTVFTYLFLPFSGEKKARARQACGAKHT